MTKVKIKMKKYSLQTKSVQAQQNTGKIDNNHTNHIKITVQTIFAFLFLFGTSVLGQQVTTITPGANPSSVVIMGDSLTFLPILFSTTSMNNAELEVEVPDGFELLVSTPDFKSGSLSANKRKGRILVSLTATISVPVTVYVKALCNAETATQLTDRVITYTLYPSATGASLVTTNTNEIQNFNNPILKVAYPASAIVPLRSTQQRTFTIIQTKDFSHVNNLQIDALCDNSNFLISKVEARRNDGQQWIEVDIVTTADGYRYIIERDKVFTPTNGYPNHKLGYNDTLIIRETVSLNSCDKGSVNYSISYGDGVDFCASASPVNVTYSQPDYAYTPDIAQTAYSLPGGPDSDGRFVTFIVNNSAQTEATMHDVYVNCTGITYYVFKSAYFTDVAGNPILNNGTDTVFLNMTKISIDEYKIEFDSLNKPAMASYYAARGLRDLDGDGIYNDLEKGNRVYFTVIYNHELATGSCPSYLVPSTTRIFRIYYKTFCKGNYLNYVRNYIIGETIGSTNVWQGRFGFTLIQNLSVSPGTLPINGTARISGNLYATSDGTVVHSRGKSLFNSAINGVSSYFSIIVLPEGLSFDATQNNPVKIGTTALTQGTHYTVSATLDTIRIQWKADWGCNNYGFDIAVKNNGTADNTKTFKIYHEYDYGNTGFLQRFSCLNAPAPYIQVLPCDYMEITSLNIERRSFGYTDTTKTNRVTHPDTARKRGFNMKIISPYDNVDVEGKFKANKSISTAGNQIRIEFSYMYNNATALLDTISGNLNGISLYYNDSATPIQIPNSAMTKGWTSGTKTQLIRFDIAPSLRNNNVNTLNINDSVKVVMHLRATTALPTTGVDLSAQMQSVTVIDSTTYNCSPLMDIVRIWDSDWGVKNNSYLSGGISNFYHSNTYNTGGLDLVVAWNTGQSNDVWGDEYRPNGDNFSSITVRYPNLIRINSVSMCAAGIRGNMINGRILTSSEYDVTYSNGSTYLTIKQGITKDYMSSTALTGMGYSVNFDMINPTAPNEGYMPNRWQTFSFDNYPTSANPQPFTVTGGTAYLAANGGMFNYPYRYTIVPISPNVEPTSTLVEWTIRLTNQSFFLSSNNNLPHSWLAVECPAGVVPVELRNASSGTAVAASFESYANNKYWIKIGNISANPTADYILSCTYTICTGTPQLTLKYGMSKVDYPTNPDAGYSNYGSPGILAGLVSTIITYTPPTIEFAGHLTHTTNAANNTNNFCDVVVFEGEYSNGLASNVADLRLRVILPAGASYYSTDIPQVKFGNGTWTNVASVNTSVSGELLITLDDSKELHAFGSADNGAYAWVRYTLFVSCGIMDGIQFSAEFIGYSGCKKETIKRTADVVPLKIFGLSPPPQYIVTKSLTPNTNYIYTDTSSSTNGSMNLSGTYQLIENAETNIIAIIDLPPNLKMISQSGDLTFTQDGTSLVADFPSNATSGALYRINNLVLVPENPTQWTEDSVTIYIRTGKRFEMKCEGADCDVLDRITLDSVKFALKMLEIHFSDSIVASSSYGSPTSEQVEIKGWLVNKETIAAFKAGQLKMELMYRSGASYVSTTAIVTGLTVDSVAHKDSTQFIVKADIPNNENVCEMLLVLRKTGSGTSNAYLANADTIVVPSPRYEIMTQPSEICQMAVNTSIGEAKITNYMYSWSPSDYLNNANTTPTNFTYGYQTKPVANDTTLIYLVSITRPNSCVSTDTIFVPLKGIPSVNVKDTAVCHNTSLNITFTDATNNTPATPTTFTWTIANGSSVGLLANGNSNINVTQVTNPTTSPVTATVTVTPSKNGCDGVDETFTITVYTPLNAGSISNTKTYCYGGIVPAIFLGANSSTGGSGNYTYRWEDSTKQTTWKSISVSNQTYNINGDLNQTTYYRRAVIDICGTAYSDTITVHPVPKVSGLTDICPGLTTHLTPNTNGFWESSDSSIVDIVKNGIIVGIKPGNADLTFYDSSAGGCSSPLTITVNDYPVPDEIIASAKVVCIGKTIELSNTTPDGVWTCNNTNISLSNPVDNPAKVTVTGKKEGNSFVTYTVSNVGCQTKRTFRVKVTNNTPPKIIIGVER